MGSSLGPVLGFEVADDSRTVGDLAGVGVAYSSRVVNNGSLDREQGAE
ncbi:MAG: hypothetical protein WCU88_07080 [Elusimicrobiota bacterium]